MSGKTVEGKRGLMGAFRIPKLCKNPTLTYDENAVEIDGKGFSGTIPVSAISAVFFETKRSTSLLIGAILAVIISIIFTAAIMIERGTEDGALAVFNLFSIAAIILFVMYFRTKNAVLSIISDSYAYTLSVKGKGETVDDLEKAKDELSKIVVAGRKAIN